VDEKVCIQKWMRKCYSNGEYFVGHTHMHVPNKGGIGSKHDAGFSLARSCSIGTIHHGDVHMHMGG
jgi:hypothetical protein